MVAATSASVQLWSSRQNGSTKTKTDRSEPKMGSVAPNGVAFT